MTESYEWRQRDSDFLAYLVNTLKPHMSKVTEPLVEAIFDAIVEAVDLDDAKKTALKYPIDRVVILTAAIACLTNMNPEIESENQFRQMSELMSDLQKAAYLEMMTSDVVTED